MTHNDDYSRDGFEYFKSCLDWKHPKIDYPRLFTSRDILLNDHPLIDSPPIVGVTFADTIAEMQRKVTEEGETLIMNACRAVNVDPDALIKTAQKNAELQELLKTIREETRRETIKEIMRYLDEKIAERILSDE